MVNHRAYYHSKNLSTFRNRKSSFLSITLYVILLFALSVFIFMLYSKDVLDDEHKMPFLRVEKSKSNQLCPLIFELNDYKQNPTNYKFDQGLINYTNETWSKFGREWAGCTHLYFPICYNKYWIAAELVFETSEVNIYDPDKGCLTEGQLNQCLEPVTIMFSLLAQQVGIKTNGPLKVVRSDKTSKQGTPGDCGVFVIKYIEFLSAGQEVNLVNDHHMLRWREKLAADIYGIICF